MKNSDSQRIKNAIEFLVKELKPQKVILFGSRAKNKNNINSDFDLCIIGKKPQHRRLRIIKEKLDDILGIYSADIIFYSNIESDFKKIIDETGRVLYEKNRGYISY